MDDMQFDPESSFTDEITTKAEAKASVGYLAHNETNFRLALSESGKSYDEIENIVRRTWTNLLKSCQRVGYSDIHVEFKRKQYKL